MDLRLAEKVALVTGGARRIGRGIALALAKEGAKVAVNYRERSEAAADVVRTIREDGGDAAAFQGTLASTRGRADGRSAPRAVRPIDILVNNAGVVTRHSILDVPLAEWDRVVRTNLYGCFHCSRLVGRHMVERGGEGKIVSISSIHGRVAKAAWAVLRHKAPSTCSASSSPSNWRRTGST